MQGTSRFWVRSGWFAWTGKMEIGATPSTGQEKIGEWRGTGTGVCVLYVSALWPSQGLQMILEQMMMVGVRFCKNYYLGGGRLMLIFFSFFFKTGSAFDQLPRGFIFVRIIARFCPTLAIPLPNLLCILRGHTYPSSLQSLGRQTSVCLSSNRAYLVSRH